MSNTPSDAEIRGLAAEGNGAYQDDETAVWEITDPSLIKFARAVLAKWGTLRADRIVIPTDTMEQEFQKHYRRGYEAGRKAAQGDTP